MATTIHHTTKKSAEKQGVILEVDGAIVRAFIPKNGTVAFGVSGQDALKQALAAQEILNFSNENVRYRVGDEFKQRGKLEKNGKTGEPEMSLIEGTPVELLHIYMEGKMEWDDEPKATGDTADDIKDTLGNEDAAASTEPTDVTTPSVGDTFAEDEHPKDPPTDSRPVIARSENGVALDGAVAYREGITAADCPFSSETEDDEEYARFEKWNEEWDAAADEAQEEEDGKTGSVVASKYREKYKEQGHTTHCGDWLAELLNNFCIGDKNTDLETAERIFGMNNVDTSKYKREGVGWQGRIRMTGRNLLAKVVFRAGYINVPNDEVDGGIQRITAPADWIAAQRYTKPAEAK